MKKSKSSVLVGVVSEAGLEPIRSSYHSFQDSLLPSGLSADFWVIDNGSRDSRVEDFFGKLARKGNAGFLKLPSRSSLSRAWNTLHREALAQGYDFVIQSHPAALYSLGWLDRFIAHLSQGTDPLVPLLHRPQPVMYPLGPGEDPQDIRTHLPRWMAFTDPQLTSDYTLREVGQFKSAKEIPWATEHLVGFRAEFLSHLGGKPWNEGLPISRPYGGAQLAELGLRAGLNPRLAKNVYLHVLDLSADTLSPPPRLSLLQLQSEETPEAA